MNILQGLNVVLRIVWVETVMRFRISNVEGRMLDFFMASLEVIRRGHWNFYRYFQSYRIHYLDFTLMY